MNGDYAKPCESVLLFLIFCIVAMPISIMLNFQLHSMFIVDACFMFNVFDCGNVKVSPGNLNFLRTAADDLTILNSHLWAKLSVIFQVQTSWEAGMWIFFGASIIFFLGVNCYMCYVGSYVATVNNRNHAHQSSSLPCKK